MTFRPAIDFGEQLIGLVGGSSRIPSAATLLHRALGIVPTVLDQPKLVVAEGALPQPPTAAAAPPAPTAAPPRRRRIAPVVAAGVAALAVAVFPATATLAR